MKLSQEADEFIKEQQKIILDTLGIDIIQHILTTLLGCSDQICRYIITEKNLLAVPTNVKYCMLQVHSILNCLSAASKGESVEVGGHLPVNDEAWQSEEDFEKRFILLIKLFYKQLKEEGKI